VKIFDVIVSGVGSMGSAACYYLAKSGVKILGIEQFDIPHAKGSHTGQTRIIRKAYFEDPAYVPLLERAYKNWKDFEKESNTPLYYPTGLLYHGHPNHPVIKGTKLSSSLYNVQLNDLDTAYVQSHFPQFKLPNKYTSFIEPDAGFVTPERSIKAYTDAAMALGAEIHANEKVLEWKKEDDTIKVVTDKDEYRSKKLVISAGAWTKKVIPGINEDLTVTRQTLAWIKVKDPEQYKLGTMPCWIIAPDDAGGVYYGFPVLTAGEIDGPVGFKLAHHYAADLTDPDDVDRSITKKDNDRIEKIAREFFAIDEVNFVEMKICLYTNTKDENFIIDFLPGYGMDVVVACGFSGHGFKFVPVVGEILCDLALDGKSEMPIEFLRFGRDMNRIPTFEI
jgi:sarcosine oxidase